MSKIRQSNIEMLRIILMLMIVINHIISHGVLDYNEIIGNTLIFYRMIIAFVVPAVISFVLISGYFSIHGSLFGGGKILASKYGIVAGKYFDFFVRMSCGYNERLCVIYI